MFLDWKPPGNFQPITMNRLLLPLLTAVALAAPLKTFSAETNTLRDRLRDRATEKSAAASDPEFSLDVAGLKRTYLVHLPKGYDGKSALPLVIVFHGGG